MTVEDFTLASYLHIGQILLCEEAVQVVDNLFLTLIIDLSLVEIAVAMSLAADGTSRSGRGGLTHADLLDVGAPEGHVPEILVTGGHGPVGWPVLGTK